MQMQMSDPSNVLGQAIEDLTEHGKRFHKLIEANEPVDEIELPPELTPMTRDKNDIYVDPDSTPFSPPNPLLPQRRPQEHGASLAPSESLANVSLRVGPNALPSSRFLSSSPNRSGAAR